MRELKFRAWDKHEKKFIYKFLMSSTDDKDSDDWTCPLTLGEHNGHTEWLNNDQLIISQYTGLKDKNEKPIYEGDILRYADTVCVVEFEEKYARFILRDMSDDFPLSFDARLLADMEIIGNIHENPELLKEAK